MRREEKPEPVSERLRRKLSAQFARRLKQRQQSKRRLSRTRDYADVQYGARLKTVQRYVDGFDTKAYRDLLKKGEPRSARAKATRRKLRSKVNATWKKLQPFLARPHVRVAVRSKRAEKALRKYSAFPRIEGLKAVTVSTPAPKKTRVRVDRRGRVELSIGKRYREKLYLFPHLPIDPDDMLDMAEEMIPRLPMGYYLIVTAHHDLLPTIAHRNQLLDELRMLVYQYRDESGFLAMVRGFKWLGHTRESAAKYQRDMSAARRNAFIERRNAQDAVREMVRVRRKKKRLSKRTLLTGKS